MEEADQAPGRLVGDCRVHDEHQQRVDGQDSQDARVGVRRRSSGPRGDDADGGETEDQALGPEGRAARGRVDEQPEVVVPGVDVPRRIGRPLQVVRVGPNRVPHAGGVAQERREEQARPPRPRLRGRRARLGPGSSPAPVPPRRHVAARRTRPPRVPRASRRAPRAPSPWSRASGPPHSRPRGPRRPAAAGGSGTRRGARGSSTPRAASRGCSSGCSRPSPARWRRGAPRPGRPAGRGRAVSRRARRRAPSRSRPAPSAASPRRSPRSAVRPGARPARASGSRASARGSPRDRRRSRRPRGASRACPRESPRPRASAARRGRGSAGLPRARPGRGRGRPRAPASHGQFPARPVSGSLDEPVRLGRVRGLHVGAVPRGAACVRAAPRCRSTGTRRAAPRTRSRCADFGPPLQARSQSAWCPSTRGSVFSGRLYSRCARAAAAAACPTSPRREDPLLADEEDAVPAFAEALDGVVRVDARGVGGRRPPSYQKTETGPMLPRAAKR